MRDQDFQQWLAEQWQLLLDAGLLKQGRGYDGAEENFDADRP